MIDRENTEVIDTEANALAPGETTTTPAVTEPEVPEQTPAPASEKPSSELPSWAWARIHEGTNKARAEAAARAKAEDENRSLKEMLSRIQRGDNKDGQPAPVTSREQSAPDFEAAVQREAQARSIRQSRDDIIRNGYTEFGQQKFDEAANVLAAFNLVGDDFISDALAVDRAGAHKLLAKIAAEPEKASRLAAMDSKSRIAEMTRMSFADNQEQKPSSQPTRQVSKAPPPKPPINPVGTPGDPNDLMDESISDEEFYRRHKAKYKL
jgi:hypothetical protein